MADSPRVFDAKSAQRIADATRWVERQRGQVPPVTSGGVQTTSPTWVRVTSSTPDGDGLHPGVVCLYSASEEDWQEYSAVKVRGANGEGLVSGVRYPARPSGRTGDGDELFTVLQAIGDSLTVADASYTPEVAGVTVLGFVDAGLYSGFRITPSVTPGYVQIGLEQGGWTTINETPGGLTGTITGGQQIFYGTKGFERAIVIHGSDSDGRRLIMPTGVMPTTNEQIAGYPDFGQDAWSLVAANSGIVPVLKFSAGADYFGDTDNAVVKIATTNTDSDDANQQATLSVHASGSRRVELIAAYHGDYESRVAIDGVNGATNTTGGLSFKGGIYTGGDLAVSGSDITGTIDGGTW